MLLLACQGEDAKTAAYRLLALALKERWGMDALPETARGVYGKPCFPQHPHIHFNISHSDGYALCAVADSPVGVDIERVCPRGEYLPRRVLTAEEYRWWESNGGDWGGFYALWTRKESFCKQKGGSVLHPRTVCPPLPGETDGSLVLTAFQGENWRAAVCAAQLAPPIRWVEF